MTAPYFITSIVISIILFYTLGFVIHPSNNDGGILLIIAIIISFQLSFITAILLDKRTTK